MTNQIEISVLLPTYQGDDPAALNQALESVVEQTCPPKEIVLVRDGPLTTELNNIIDDWRDNGRVPLSCVSLTENIGLGGALREGMKHISTDYVARMDSDDISVSDRFEVQSSYLKDNQEVDILGGYIEEFDESISTSVAKRTVPLDHEDIMKMARFRSPFNHATVTMRTEAVLSAGNYRAVDGLEDWDLWSRMLLNGSVASNLPRVLLRVRSGDEMYTRRGGIKYAKAEFKRQREFLRRDFITPYQFARNLLLRIPIRFVPNRVRGLIYKQLLRQRTE